VHTYALIEIKLGGERLINEGAASLKTLAATIDTTKMKYPSFMMVLTAVGPYAFRRPDGVFVVPSYSDFRFIKCQQITIIGLLSPIIEKIEPFSCLCGKFSVFLPHNLRRYGYQNDA
jgi:hypothetical protein